MHPFARANWPNLYLLALPVVVALLAWGAGFAALAVMLGLLWKWAQGMLALAPGRGPAPLRLETIGGSHIVEKVRWQLDRLGVPYEEDRVAGVIGILTGARTVPRLTVPMGPSTSRIGESTEILRYLWGRYGVSHREEAAFLAPTAESLALEGRMDQYALDVRRWLYWNALPQRDLMLRLWGGADPTLPGWQRFSLRIGYPVLERFIRRALRVDADSTQRSVERAQAFLADIEARLEAGSSLLGQGPLHSVDLQLAALSGHWACPERFGGPSIAPHYGVAPEALPPIVRAAYDEWQAKFPRTTAYVRRLYAEERGAPGVAAFAGFGRRGPGPQASSPSTR